VELTDGLARDPRKKGCFGAIGGRKKEKRVGGVKALIALLRVRERRRSAPFGKICETPHMKR